MKVVNNYKDYNYFYKSLKGLILYKSNFTTLPNILKGIIAICSLNIVLEDKTMSRVRKEIKVIKKNLTF
ncbi:hypothetical protein C8034_v008360 [Colletotrichum sidae]|uniref:HAT C-terminal dimerisation domain-containing protein n=1 Tax=Colletotrichum sidae TaxID=1347389 RepID=A0A4R8T2C1_9PEZI|nr:hypothetical protein C8034_v008360 [Colletotrichum sidae]